MEFEDEPRLTVIKLRDDSIDEKPSKLWLHFLLAATGVTSIVGFIFLVLLLAIPVSMLVVGAHYGNDDFCPIEPRISLFLTVGGAAALAYFALSILLSVIARFYNYNQSMIKLVIIVVLALIIILIHIFLIIWVIIGSVWTFSIYNKVQYTNTRRRQTYCDRTLYVFTFVYLIIIYVTWALQCCIRCIFAVVGARKH